MNPSIARMSIAIPAVVWAACAPAEQLSEEGQLALVYGDKATVSIATGSRQTLRRAPSVASVITAGDMAAMGTKDLDEVLETVPDVHVLTANSRYFSTYQFRDMIGNPERYGRQTRLSVFATYADFTGHNWRFGQGHDDLDIYKTAIHKNSLLNAVGVPIPTAMVDDSTIKPHLLPQRRNADVREPGPGSEMPCMIPGDLPMAPRSLWLQMVYTP